MTAFTNPLRVRSHADRAPTGPRRPATTTRSSTALLLVATVAVLNVVGVVMVLSASSVASLTDYGSPWYFFFRQIMWTVLGLGAFVFAIRFDYRRWRGLIRPLLIISAVLLVVVLVPGVGIYVSGSRRWLGAGMLRFQPSEIAKLALLLYAADLVSRRGGELHDWRRVVRPVMLVLALFTALVMKEPDLGSAMVLAIVVLAVLVAGGVKKRHLAVVFGLGISAVTFLALAEPYRRTRMLTFLDPFADSSNAGYQISQSLIALGSGGLTGVGLGASRAKWNFLPNAHTDFIFAIIGEELGLIGCFLVMGLFIAFAVLGARAALRAPDRFGALIAAGRDRVGGGPGGHQHRRRRGPPAGHRHPAPVRVVRRLGADHHHARHRHPRERRAAGPHAPRTAPHGPAAHRTPYRRASVTPKVVTGTDVLISGGGTGGHVFPALALAEELVARGYARDRIRFVGAARGLEATAVPAAGFAIDLLPGPRPGTQRVGRGDPAEPPHQLRHVGRVRPRRRRSSVGSGPASSWASVATRRCPRWWPRAPGASRPSSTRPMPTPASPTGSRCASAPGPPSPCPARPSRARSSPATRSGPPSPRSSGRRWRRPWSRWSAAASAPAR